MPTLKKCPDCGGELEHGTIADFSHGVIVPQQYLRGEVVKSSLQPFGKFSKLDNFKGVTTYRCTQCDRLFSYADGPAKSMANLQKSQLKVVGGILLFMFILSMLIIAFL